MAKSDREKPEKKIEGTDTMVQLNRESAFSIQLPHIKNEASVTPGETIQLVPGMNLVDTAKWDLAKKNAIVVAYLDEKIKPSKSPETNPERVGSYVIVEGLALPKAEPLSALDEKDALEFVDESLEVKILRRVLKSETRERVKLAILEKINEIENPKVRKSA